MPLKCELLVRPVRLTERSENPRAVACLRAERRGDCKIEALTVSMLAGDLMIRGPPALRLVALAVCLNVGNRVTIDFRDRAQGWYIDAGSQKAC